MKVYVAGSGVLAQVTLRNLPAEYVCYDPAKCDIAWMCFDTELNEDGSPKTADTIAAIEIVMGKCMVGTKILISSQLPVGSTRTLATKHPLRKFFYSPENIRVAHAQDDFSMQPRIILGSSKEDSYVFDYTVATLLQRFTADLIRTDWETAELCKTALNAHLAMQIRFANELAELAKEHGADMATLTRALRTDPRIGARAYLEAGPPPSRHLVRELHNLRSLGAGRFPLLGALTP